MKIWEMIKELTENPNKKFISKHRDKSIASTFAVVEEGGIFFKNPLEKPTALYYIGFDWEWEEIKELVSFMEAVKSCRKIRVEHELVDDSDIDDLITFTSIDCLLYALGEEYNAIQVRNIIENGKWYIG